MSAHIGLCVYCGRAVGHSRRCSVTKFDAPPYRMSDPDDAGHATAGFIVGGCRGARGHAHPDRKDSLMLSTKPVRALLALAFALLCFSVGIAVAADSGAQTRTKAYSVTVALTSHTPGVGTMVVRGPGHQIVGVVRFTATPGSARRVGELIRFDALNGHTQLPTAPAPVGLPAKPVTDAPPGVKGP